LAKVGFSKISSTEHLHPNQLSNCWGFFAVSHLTKLSTETLDGSEMEDSQNHQIF